jgi:hypothetical protein
MKDGERERRLTLTAVLVLRSSLFTERPSANLGILQIYDLRERLNNNHHTEVLNSARPPGRVGSLQEV